MFNSSLLVYQRVNRKISYRVASVHLENVQLHGTSAATWASSTDVSAPSLGDGHRLTPPVKASNVGLWGCWYLVSKRWPSSHQKITLKMLQKSHQKITKRYQAFQSSPDLYLLSSSTPTSILTNLTDWLIDWLTDMKHSERGTAPFATVRPPNPPPDAECIGRTLYLAIWPASTQSAQLRQFCNAPTTDPAQSLNTMSVPRSCRVILRGQQVKHYCLQELSTLSNQQPSFTS